MTDPIEEARKSSVPLTTAMACPRCATEFTSVGGLSAGARLNDDGGVDAHTAICCENCGAWLGATENGGGLRLLFPVEVAELTAQRPEMAEVADKLAARFNIETGLSKLAFMQGPPELVIDALIGMMAHVLKSVSVPETIDQNAQEAAEKVYLVTMGSPRSDTLSDRMIDAAESVLFNRRMAWIDGTIPDKELARQVLIAGLKDAETEL